MHAKQRLSILSLALTLVAAAPAFAQDAADQKSLPAQLVDALNAVFGKQTDNRAVHAKGIVLEGNSPRAPRLRSLSKAPHLQAGRHRARSPSASRTLPACRRSPTPTRMQARAAWR